MQNKGNCFKMPCSGCGSVTECLPYVLAGSTLLQRKRFEKVVVNTEIKGLERWVSGKYMLDKPGDLSRDARYPQKADEVAQACSQGAGELETGRSQGPTKHHETLSQRPWWRGTMEEIKYLCLAFAGTLLHRHTPQKKRKKSTIMKPR